MLTHGSGSELRGAASGHRYVWLFVAVLVGAELLAVAGNPVLTLYLQGALLFFLLLRTQFLSGPERDFHIALAVVPLVPILSLTPSIRVAPVWTALPMGQGVLVAALLLCGTLVAARVIGYRPVAALRPRALLYLPLFVAVGLVAGALAYVVVQPSALTQTLTLRSVFWPAFSLIFIAISEELLFRGLLLAAAVELLGSRQGVAFAALVYASLLLGRQPWLLAGLALLIGLGFGWLALCRRSVVGVSFAHSVALLALWFIFPNALQGGG